MSSHPGVKQKKMPCYYLLPAVFPTLTILLEALLTRMRYPRDHFERSCLRLDKVDLCCWLPTLIRHLWTLTLWNGPEFQNPSGSKCLSKFDISRKKVTFREKNTETPLSTAWQLFAKLCDLHSIHEFWQIDHLGLTFSSGIDLYIQTVIFLPRLTTCKHFTYSFPIHGRRGEAGNDNFWKTSRFPSTGTRHQTAAELKKRLQSRKKIWKPWMICQSICHTPLVVVTSHVAELHVPGIPDCPSSV